jgi:hypothetical protein
MLEGPFLTAVLDLCQTMHLRAVHFPPAYTAKGRIITNYRGDGVGWLDIHILGAGGVIYAELKTATGRLTAEQAQYKADLEAAGCTVRVWRPADLLSGAIQRDLAAIRRPLPVGGAV